MKDIGRKFQLAFDLNGLEQLQRKKQAEPGQNEIFSH